MPDNYPINALTSTQAQVDTFTPATVEINDIFTLTITGDDGTTHAVNFTATAATVANVTAGLTAAWNASTHRLATPITAADQTTTMKLTADTAGQPFSVASSTTDGGGANTQTLTKASTTASIGPKDWGLAGNWFLNSVPVDADNITIDARATNDLIYSLNQSSVDPATLNIYQSYTHSLGSVDSPLRISPVAMKIGLPSEDGSRGSGPTLVNIDTGSNANTTDIYDSRTTGTSGLLPINLKGAHASNVIRVHGGTVGLATARPGDTATYPSIHVNGGTAIVGAGVTATTIQQNGGKLTLNVAATTVTQDGGTLETKGSGAVTTMYVGGTAKLNSTGTITTLEVRPGGKADFSGNTAARTVTTLRMYKGATLDLDNGVPGSITLTNPIEYHECGIQDVTIRTPRHVKGTLTNI